MRPTRYQLRYCRACAMFWGWKTTCARAATAQLVTCWSVTRKSPARTLTSAAGNGAQVFRVVGGNINRYATADLHGVSSTGKHSQKQASRELVTNLVLEALS